MTEANNHFGIKCNNGWQGPTFTHTDDRPNECFKKYTCAAESFRDHSLHLKKNPRYSPLFALSTTDYASWAVCLKKCGYATNPQYAQKLIKIIEEYKLQQYTYAAMDSAFSGWPGNRTAAAPVVEPVALPIEEELKISTPPVAVQNEVKAPDAVPDTIAEEPAYATAGIETVNGMKAFFARKDEMLLGYAVKYNVRYPRLLEMNDLRDGPVPCDMYVYLEKKLTFGVHETHLVANGESLMMIAQSEGMQLKKLMALNMLYANEEPAPGAILQLQKQAAQRPEVISKEITAHRENAIVAAAGSDTAKGGSYIVIDKTKTVQATPASSGMYMSKVKPEYEASATATQEQVQNTPSDASYSRTAPVKVNDELEKSMFADDSRMKAEAPATIAHQVATPEPVKAKAVRYHTIQKGETAYSIAKKNNVTVEQLYEWNGIDASGIKTGKSIVIKE